MGSQTTEWILKLVDQITAPMRGISDAAESAADSVSGVGKKADESNSKMKKMSAIDLFAVKDAVTSLADDFNELNAPGAAFNAQLKEVEAITGVTGNALDDLGGKARQTAKDFGGDASAMMESYKGVLSRLGPEIGNNQDALDMMGKNIATLSKTMKNDATGAMDALTTGMLQFGTELSDPMYAAQEMSRMMNVMAAGAKFGAAEVPQISAALKQAGIQAKDSNVSFEETNAALQALAAGGKYGSDAGIALRNVLGKMAGIDVLPKDAADKLKSLGVDYDIVSDKTLPFTDRLRELKKAQGDATIMAKVFGTENAAAASIMLNSVDSQDKMVKAITGTNTATEQASIIMSGYTETMSRAKAWFTDIAIGAFDVTSAIAPMMNGLAGGISIFADLANARQGILLLFNTMKTMPVIGSIVSAGSAIATGGFAGMTAAANSLGVAIMNIPILGWIAALVAALAALSVYFYNTSSTFRGFVWGIWESVKAVFGGMFDFISNVAEGIWHILKGIYNPVNWIDPNYSFSEGLSKITDAAEKYGNAVGESFAKGKQDGINDFETDGKTPESSKIFTKPSGANISPSLTTADLLKKKKTDTNTSTLGGSGGGSSVKSVNQKIEMKNYFTISSETSKGEIDSVAEKVIMAINNKLRDGMATAAV